MGIGSRIKVLREARGLSGYALAQAAGITPSRLKAIEDEDTEHPRSDTLARLAAALGVPMDDLAGSPCLPASREHDAARPEHTVEVPFRAVAAGGPAIEFVEVPEESYRVLRHLATKDRYVIKIMGESMFPTFHNGDLLLVEPATKVKDGTPAIVLVRGETTVKRVHKMKRGGFILKADNPLYPPMEEDAEDVEIKGRILRIVDGVRP